MPNATSHVTGGSCGNGSTDQFIVISWDDGKTSNSLNLTFSSTGKEFHVKEIVADFSAHVVPPAANKTTTKFYNVQSVFQTPKERSYHCTKVQSFNLTNAEVNGTTVGTIAFSHVLMEAYQTDKNKGFSTPVDCDAMDTPGRMEKHCY